MFLKSFTTIITGSLLLALTACQNGTNFGLSSVNQGYQQRVSETIVKVDVLWVVDSSGSMETSQTEVANNFQSFINKFQSSQFDFQMAVVSTDAWVDHIGATDPVHNKSIGRSRFNDRIYDAEGKIVLGNSGTFVLDTNTPNLDQTFVEAVRVGVVGNSDERGLQSLVGALENTANKADGFPRADALLAVIVLTDEEDYSHDGQDFLPDGSDIYANPALHPVSDYYDYLMDYTNSTQENQKFIFNAISIFDDACLAELNTGDFQGRVKGLRYQELAVMTGGYQGSLCDDFSDVMSGITDRILEFTTRFPLNREPIVDTIRVYVNEAEVAQDVTNGWTYDSVSNSIVFHGTAIPPQSALVLINFDPTGLKN